MYAYDVMQRLMLELNNIIFLMMSQQFRTNTSEFAYTIAGN